MNPENSQKLAEIVMLITHFCQVPKDSSMLNRMDAWGVFTGDGFRLANHVLARRSYPGVENPAIFITGPDNLLLAEEGEEIKASHLGKWLRDQGVPARTIIIDDDPASQYTHGQAKRLIHFAQENGWRRLALFTSGHHILRAWLTVLAQMSQLGIPPSDLLVIPEPAYRFSFMGENLELENYQPSWDYFTQESVPRILRYQEKVPPDVASWEEALQYLRWHQILFL